MLGDVGALVRFVRNLVTHRVDDPYRDLRKNLSRVILLGLEVLIIADIIRTIVVDQSVESVTVLGIVVLIRVVLSFSLEVEIDGMCPWNKWRTVPEASRPDESSSPTGTVRRSTQNPPPRTIITDETRVEP